MARNVRLCRFELLSRAVREELTRIGDAGRLACENPLPGLADAKSQLATPLEARGEVLGVLCLQSDAAGRFLARDESHLQLLARHLAVSMIAVGLPAARNPRPRRRRRVCRPLHSTRLVWRPTAPASQCAIFHPMTACSSMMPI